MCDLQLCGDIPELLRRGSPVNFLKRKRLAGEPEARPWHGPTGVVTQVFDGALTVLVTSHGGEADGNGEVRTSRLALDLSDLTGRYHARLWVGARGYDLRWAKDIPEALAWSVLSVSQGRKPLADILHPWREVTQNDPDTGAAWIRGRAFNPKNRGGGLFVASFLRPWRTFGWENACVPTGPEHPGIWLRGPEVGEEGRAAADRSALEACFGLMNEDGTLTLPPLPQGKP